MGLTGFNLARREEEAAAQAVASASSEPEVCSMPEQKEEAPKRGRKKVEDQG